MRKVWQGMPTAADIHGDRWNKIADHCNTNSFILIWNDTH
jgi:hypothetical protein